MTSLRFLVLGLGLTLAAGCVRSHRVPTTVYRPVVTPAPAPVVVAPTSDRPEVRVYTDPGTRVEPVPVAPPADPLPVTDLVLADSINRILREDQLLSPAARNVTVAVDEGVVTLRGTVPSESQRLALEDRLEKLPGVRSVNNNLSVDIR